MEQLGLEAVAMSETGRAAAAHRWLGFDGRGWNRRSVEPFEPTNPSEGNGGGEMGDGEERSERWSGLWRDRASEPSDAEGI